MREMTRRGTMAALAAATILGLAGVASAENGSGNSRNPTASIPRGRRSARFLSMTCPPPDRTTLSVTRSDEAGSRRLLLDLFLDQHRVSLLGDRVMRPAFEEIGRQWECGDVEVYRERFACRICARG